MIKNILLILFCFSFSIIGNGQKIQKFQVISKGENISDIQFGKGNDLFVLSHNGQVKKLNIVTNTSFTFDVKAKSMGISTSAEVFALGTADGALLVYNNQEQVKNFKAHRNLISHITFSSSDKYMATSSPDSTIKVWSAKTFELLQVIDTKSDWVTDMKFSLDEQFLVYSTSKGKVMVWNLDERNIFSATRISDRWISNIAICPDSLKYAVCGDHHNITIFTFKDMVFYPLKKAHKNLISNLQFINKDYLMTISHDHRVSMTNINIPVEKAELKHFDGNARYKRYLYDIQGDKYFSAIAISGEKKTVAISSYGKGIALINNFHKLIENPHKITIKEVNNKKIDSVGVDHEFLVNKNIGVIKGSITRPDAIRKAWLYIVNDDKHVKLRMDNNGDFKLQAGIYGGITDYAIIIEDWDRNLKTVRYDFRLKQVE